MKRTQVKKKSKQGSLLAACFLVSAAVVAAGQARQQTPAPALPATYSDPVLKAMGDELNRSITQLKLNDLDKPYFIQYTVYDDEDFKASATFGSLTRTSPSHDRVVHAQVRVGDYDFDNTGFAGGRGGGGGSTGAGLQTTLDDDYDALRHSLWLATDAAYKSAVETIAQKRAYTQNRTQQEDPVPDFSKEKATVAFSPKMKMQLERAKVETQLRELSKIFRDFPAVQTSSVTYHARLNHRYIVNSEGT